MMIRRWERSALLLAIANNPDRDWERWAKIDPYYAVLTADRYKKDNIDTDEFFRSGELHIARIFETLYRLDPAFRPKVSLDFGCGVGRLLIPLSRISQRVVGVDISPTMLGTAEQNLYERGIANCSLIESDDSLSRVPGGMDFIHSFIVFQHIPAKQGEKIFAALLSKLAPGGMGAVHFPFWRYASRLHKFATAATNRFDVLNKIANVLRGRPMFQPKMQYNHYSLDRLYRLLYEANCSRIHCEFVFEEPQHLTGVLFFKTHDQGSLSAATAYSSEG